MQVLKTSQGFTLLEVIVAVAIAGLGLFTLVSLVVSSVALEEHARMTVEAANIADMLLREIERDGVTETGNIEGEIDNSSFTYQKQIAETMIPDVFSVDVTVYWANQKESLTMSTYVFKKQ